MTDSNPHTASGDDSDSPSEGDNTDTSGNTIRELLGESSQTVFQNKRLLDPSTIIEQGRVVGRSEQLEELVRLLRPILDRDVPHDLLLYGPSGTGKSLSINLVSREIATLCEQNDIVFATLKINCQALSTYDGAMYALVKEAAQQAGVSPEVPETGVSSTQKLNRFLDILNTHFDAAIVIVDEIDLLVGYESDDNPDYSDLLYQLSRSRELGLETDLSVAAISNAPGFLDELDGRVSSTFNPQYIQYPDYDAEQLQTILNRRKDAFKHGALDESDGVIELSAALAAQDHGDARQAIDLLRVAGDMANKLGDTVVTTDHVYQAQERAERDIILSQMQGLSIQKRLTLYSLAITHRYSPDQTGNIPKTIIYNVYRRLCETMSESGASNQEPKHKQSYTRYLSELETYDYVTSQRKSHGRGGMHRHYRLVLDVGVTLDALEADVSLGHFRENEQSATEIKQIVTEELSKFNN